MSHKIPGPPMAWLFQFLRQPREKRDLLAELQNLFTTYGDIVKIPSIFRPLYFVSDPGLIAKLLANTEKSVAKAVIYRRLRMLIGAGLLTSEGAFWKQQRKLTSPAFHPRLANSFQTVIHECTMNVVEKWKRHVSTEAELDISREMSRLTLSIMSRIVFTDDLGEDAEIIFDSLEQMQDHANALFFSYLPLPLWIPTRRNRKTRRAIANMDRVLYRIIAEHRAEPDTYKDLLASFIASRDELTGQGMTDRQLRDELMTLIIAGHDTTATTLSGVLDRVARDPEIAGKLALEVAKADDFDPASLPYTNMVIQETMRLFPAIWSLARVAKEAFTHNGITYAAGSIFCLSQYHTHRNPHFWERPEEFRPERFSEAETQARPLYAFFPFGGGARICVGAHLAKLEASIAVATLIENFRFERVEGHSYRLRPNATMSYDPGIRLRVSPIPMKVEAAS